LSSDGDVVQRQRGAQVAAPGLRVGGQLQDAVMIVTQPELGGAAEHAAGLHAAQLGLA
jgi:hypothetical protein